MKRIRRIKSKTSIVLMSSPFFSRFFYILNSLFVSKKNLFFERVTKIARIIANTSKMPMLDSAFHSRFALRLTPFPINRMSIFFTARNGF